MGAISLVYISIRLTYNHFSNIWIFIIVHKQQHNQISCNVDILLEHFILQNELWLTFQIVQFQNYSGLIQIYCSFFKRKTHCHICGVILNFLHTLHDKFTETPNKANNHSYIRQTNLYLCQKRKLPFPWIMRKFCFGFFIYPEIIHTAREKEKLLLVWDDSCKNISFVQI